MLRTLQMPLVYRVFTVTLPKVRAEGEAPVDLLELVGKGTIYPVSISSEEPATQWYWDLGLIREVLSHDKDAIQLDRIKQAGPLLWMHDRFDQIGRIHDPYVEDRRLKGGIRYMRTQRGRDFELNALDDIQVNMSVGYRPMEMELRKRGDMEKGELDEYLITQWEPHEWSIVSIPADISVGVGRQQAEEFAVRSGSRELFPVQVRDGLAVDKEGEEMSKKVTDPTPPEGGTAPEAAKPEERVASATIQVGTSERDKEVVDMFAMAKNNGIPEAKVVSAIQRGLGPAAFAEEVLRERTSVPVVTQPPAERSNAVPDRDLASYSLRKAILMTLPRSEGGIEPGGLEWEVHQELERKLPMGVRRPEGERGILVPTNMPGPDPRAAARAARALGRPFRPYQDDLGRAYPPDSVTSTEGTEFKFTTAAPMIDMLRAMLVTARLGARFLPGLPGPLGFPRKTSASTASWQSAEAAAVADSMPNFELMTLSPKTLIDTTGTTRQLLRMASEDFDALLRDDILQTHKVAIDAAAFVGSGASGQPSGLYVLSGIQSHDVGPGANADAAPDYTDITTMIGKLADAGIEAGSDPIMPAFATTPLVAATLMRTLTFPAANTGEAIWKGPVYEGLLAGYRALASNVLSKTLNNGVPGGGTEHGLVHGNFAELFIAEFGAFEIIADPYSSKKSGVIELTSFQMVDVNVRHQASFVKGINAIP